MADRAPHRVRLRDVAERAGVSVGSASQAFSRPELVSDRVRERVLDAAAALYEQAAVQGSAEAQYRLGRLFAIGSGVAQSDREAIKWLTRAAMQGQPEARAFYLYRYPKAARSE